MFFYFFGLQDKMSIKTLDEIWKQSKELKLLEAEQDSYLQAKKDLEELSKKPMQPEDFFSQDITLVKEIQVLETLGDKYNVDLSFSGISGVVSSAPRAKTQSDIVYVPYSVGLQGSFKNVVNAIEALENLDFVTTLNSMSASSGNGDTINVSLTSNFYVRRK